MDVDKARSDLAEAARILCNLGYFDLMSHVSVRLGPDVVAITPGSGANVPVPLRMTPDDIVVMHTSGRVISGPHEPPIEWPLHVAVYESRTDVGSILVGCPPATTAFGMAGRQLAALTHSQAWMAYQGAAMIDSPGLIADPERGRLVAAQLGSHPVAHLRGHAAIFVGDDLTAAVRTADTFELLAKVNLVAAEHTDSPRTVSKEHAREIDLNRSGGEKIPSRDPWRYFSSFDVSLPPEAAASSDAVEALKEKVALSCRILASQRSLVAYLEHVSQRLPDGETFLMSPAKNFADMRGSDIGVISLDDECAWLGGPYPPAPFRFYHKDMLLARPDVSGIAHTHEIYGRALTMAGVAVQPVWRVGAEWGRQIPVYEKPSMGFDPADREGAIEVLGSDRVVHLVSHGTDYLSSTLEEATVMAVQREVQVKAYHTATRLGDPAILSADVVAELAQAGPSPHDWWRYYASATPPLNGLD